MGLCVRERFLQRFPIASSDEHMHAILPGQRFLASSHAGRRTHSAVVKMGDEYQIVRGYDGFSNKASDVN